jgi:glycine betaine/proline transport system ATP-binding protein
VVEGLWKVFAAAGKRPASRLGVGFEQSMSLARQGASRSEILAATGHTVGIKDVSFSVAPGETFVVMGLSGSGKSTLVRCLTRLVEPTSGMVSIDGSDVTAMTEAELRHLRRTKMAMVFQNFGLLPHRRVIDNVAYGLEVQGMNAAARRARAMDIIETVGLSGWAHHHPQQLSGGMQQRVGLARALAVDPTVLLFDEPFSALDPLIRRDMQGELIRLQSISPRTMVFITHDFDEALLLGDRIAIMKDGVFDQIGTAEALVASPATDYVAEFTRSVSKAKVLTAASVMTSSPGPLDHADVKRTVSAATKVAELIPIMLSTDEPVGVVAGHDPRQLLGMVDREQVLNVVRSDAAGAHDRR